MAKPYGLPNQNLCYFQMLSLYHTVPTLRMKPLENIMGKGENAGNQHFLLFPTMFYSLSKIEITIYVPFDLSSAKALNLVQSENLSFGKDFFMGKSGKQDQKHS